MGKIANFVNNIIQWLLFGLIGLMALIIFVQVFCRYVLGSSLFWADELTRYLLFYITFLGSSVAMKKGYFTDMVSIRFFIDRFSLKSQRILKLTSDILIIIFLVVIIKYGVTFCKLNMSQISPAIRVPIYYVYLSIPIGCFLMAFYTIVDLINSITAKTNIDTRG